MEEWAGLVHCRPTEFRIKHDCRLGGAQFLYGWDWTLMSGATQVGGGKMPIYINKQE